MKQKYLPRFWKTLKQSVISINRRVFLIALYDLLFYMGFVASLFLWNYVVKLKSASIQINPFTLDITDKAMVDITLTSMQNFLIFTGVSMIAVFVVVVLVYSCFKGLVWLTTMKKSMSWNFLKKFSTVNLVWFFSWFVILLAVALMLRPGAGAFVIILLMLLITHLSILLTLVLIQTLDVKKTIRRTFSIGFGKLHYFLLPYLTIIAGYVIVSQLGWLLKLLPRSLELSLTVIVTLLYFSCARVYLVNVVKEAGF